MSTSMPDASLTLNRTRPRRLASLPTPRPGPSPLPRRIPSAVSFSGRPAASASHGDGTFVARRGRGDFADWSHVRTRAQPTRGRRIPPPRSLPIAQDVNRLLRQPCACVRTARTGPATDLLAVTIDTVVHQLERRVDGSTSTAEAPCAGRPQRCGSPTTVTFLAGTDRCAPINMSTVRTCPFHARTPGAKHRRNLPRISPMLGVPDIAQSAYLPNSHQYRRKRTRRELPSGRKAPLVLAPSERRIGDPASRRPDMKSAISVLEQSLLRRRMRRSVAARIRTRHERVIPIFTHRARLVVSLAVLLATTGTHSATARAGEATYEPGSTRGAPPASTKMRQETFRYGSLPSQGVSLAQASVPVAAPSTSEAQVTAEELAAEREVWASVKASEDPADVRAYLEQFPEGMFAALARNWLRRLEEAQVQAPQVTAAPVPTQVTAPAASPSPKSVEAALVLTRTQQVLVQRGLTALGFDVGAADGIFGARTRSGIGKWQSSRSEAATGYLDAEAVETLLEAREAVPPESQRKVAREATELLSEALSIARSIGDASDRAEALGTIAGAQASVGDTRGAQRTVSEALPLAPRGEFAIHRAWALGAIARAQASAGDTAGARRTVSEALRVARSATLGGDRAQALGVIAEAQASAGDTHGAQRTVSEALRTVQGRGENGRTLSPIAKAQASIGDLRGAARTISEALRIDRSGDFDNPYRVANRANVAEAQASIGDTTGAARTISKELSALQSVDEDLRDVAEGPIATALASVGDYQRAQSMSRRTYAFDRAIVLAAIVRNKFGKLPVPPRQTLVTATSATGQSGTQPSVTPGPREYWGPYIEAGDYSVGPQGFGMVWNYPDPQSAIEAALGECKKAASHEECGGSDLTRPYGFKYWLFSTSQLPSGVPRFPDSNADDGLSDHYRRFDVERSVFAVAHYPSTRNHVDTSIEETHNAITHGRREIHIQNPRALRDVAYVHQPSSWTNPTSNGSRFPRQCRKRIYRCLPIFGIVDTAGHFYRDLYLQPTFCAT